MQLSRTKLVKRIKNNMFIRSSKLVCKRGNEERWCRAYTAVCTSPRAYTIPDEDDEAR